METSLNPLQVDDGKDVEKAKLLALGTDAPVPVLETVQAPAFDSAIAETAVLDDPSIIRELAIDDPDLPLRIRAKIPNIRITKHIYSSAAYMRQVSINNRSLREKDSFTEDILISEITKVGAILAVDNYRISIRRGQDWRRQLAGN